MTTKEQLINEFGEFILFIKSLRSLNESTWSEQIQVGKWSTCDIISHIMLWDKYFLERAIEKVASNEPLTVEDIDPDDIDEINKKATDYGKTISKEKLLDETIYYRNEIIDHLKRIPETDYRKEYKTLGPKFIIADYIAEYVEHDHHHQSQIESFVKSRV